MKKQVKDLRDKSRESPSRTRTSRSSSSRRPASTIAAERVDADEVAHHQARRLPRRLRPRSAPCFASVRGLRADDFVSDDAAADLGKYGLTDAAAPGRRCGSARTRRRRRCSSARSATTSPTRRSVYAKRAELPTVVHLPDYATQEPRQEPRARCATRPCCASPRTRRRKIAVTRKDGNGFTLAKQRRRLAHRGARWRAPSAAPTIDAASSTTSPRFKGTDIVSEDPKVDLREYGLGTPRHDDRRERRRRARRSERSSARAARASPAIPTPRPSSTAVGQRHRLHGEALRLRPHRQEARRFPRCPEAVAAARACAPAAPYCGRHGPGHGWRRRRRRRGRRDGRRGRQAPRRSRRRARRRRPATSSPALASSRRAFARRRGAASGKRRERVGRADRHRVCEPGGTRDRQGRVRNAS